MKKIVTKIVVLLTLSLLIVGTFGCKKKHKWIEVGAPTISEAMKRPGVHPERGTESDALDIHLAPITYPTGRDKDGKQQYKKCMYEYLDEKTPELIDQGMKDVKLIGPDSIFCGLEISESDEVQSGGPGAIDSQLTKKGVVKYANLSSPIDNQSKYEGKYYVKDLIGLIDEESIAYAIVSTFMENFQLVSCDIKVVDSNEYEETPVG